MGNMLYLAAVILMVIWAIGFFGYGVGPIVHLLLVIAVFAIVLRLIEGRKQL